MKITTQKELDDLIATADEFKTVILDEDLEITFSCEIPCSIQAEHIKAHSIKTHYIDACDINAEHITAYNINATFDIKAHNITAWDIDACDIKAWDVKAADITAYSIKAHNITAKSIKAKIIEYYAFCIAYESLRYKSISGERKNSFHKCLDQKTEIR